MYPKCTPKCTQNVPSSWNSFSFTPKKGQNHAKRAILEPFYIISHHFEPVLHHFLAFYILKHHFYIILTSYRVHNDGVHGVHICHRHFCSTLYIALYWFYKLCTFDIFSHLAGYFAGRLFNSTIIMLKQLETCSQFRLTGLVRV